MFLRDSWLLFNIAGFPSMISSQNKAICAPAGHFLAPQTAALLPILFSTFSPGH
jgi:hypothetical protein